MKIPVERPCVCGGTYVFSTYGDDDFGEATCSQCGSAASLIDPLSVSVTGERLLYRSRADIESGDYSLSIVVGVMAVESFLTRLFLKLKGMESFAVTYELPTSAQEAQWEEEFPKSGGFPSPAGFVSQKLVGTTFDNFVATNQRASAIFSNLPSSSGVSPTEYFQDHLFQRRNRIAHWGYVNTSKSEAELCHTVTVAVVSILREIDAATDWVDLAQKMARAARAGIAEERQRLQKTFAEYQKTTPVQRTNESSR
jgi:hypothetical protein